MNMENGTIEITPNKQKNDEESPRISENDQVKPQLNPSESEVAPTQLHAREIVELVAESLPVTIIMSLFTIWALFSDDIRLAATDIDADDGFEAVISIAFFLFLLEIFAASYYKEGYLHLPSLTPEANESYKDMFNRLCNIGSFYFWLDCIATASLIFEINWIIGDAVETDDQSSLKSARAGRASRAGARAGRIVRLVRMVKLYKYFKTQAKNEEGTQIHSTSFESGGGVVAQSRRETINKKEETTDVDLSALAAESHVGAAMSDLTTRRVIVLVLVMLIAIPLMSYSTSDFAPSFGTQMVHRMAKENISNPGEYNDGFLIALSNVERNLDVVKLSINKDVYIHRKGRLDNLRSVEQITYEFTGKATTPSGDVMKVKTVGIFDKKDSIQSTAEFGIYMTIFILFLLVVGTYFFSTDVNRLVIIPIEKMVSLVQQISKNPLGVEYKMLGEDDGFLEGMETTLLLQTITKIGGLMRVGFGEAGASVIAKNLGESEDHKLNLMGSGNLIHSIFGFCDVRNFTDTTECLQEEVMLFVNRIAHILHGIVVQCSGSANKNIGDAFLLTWKIDESFSPSEVSFLADQALLAFCKALIELCRYQDFICNFSIAATNRLYKRFPGYKVRIGSGLHVGWAIEGAIGSNMKIDASYLSPHVNMSEYLESSTKAYGVPLLMSEAFFRLLSPHANKYCRQVDRIKRSDAEEPFGLFTYDADLNYEFVEDQKLKEGPSNRVLHDARRKSVAISGSLTVAPALLGSHPSQTSSSDIKSKTKLQKGKSVRDLEAQEKTNETSEKESEQDNKPNVIVPPYKESVWETDMDLMRLRHLVNDAFRTLWKEGMAAYIKGDWQKARDIFHETMRSSNAQDGPSKFLIKVIDEHGGTAPHDWQGYRQDS
mmetsp:Transcript_8812/g.13189  ORF Transcript_8812/g.13189 Transcript_8812/m.13189 type:complete len:887 (-) Transcript_8812:178-2838(-)